MTRTMPLVLIALTLIVSSAATHAAPDDLPHGPRPIKRTRFELPIALVRPGDIVPAGPAEIPIDFEPLFEQLGIAEPMGVDPASVRFVTRDGKTLPATFRVTPDAGRVPTMRGVLIVEPGEAARTAGVLRFNLWGPTPPPALDADNPAKPTRTGFRTDRYRLDLASSGNLAGIRPAGTKDSSIESVRWSIHVDKKRHHKAAEHTSGSVAISALDKAAWPGVGRVQRMTYSMGAESYATLTYRVYADCVDIELLYWPPTWKPEFSMTMTLDVPRRDDLRLVDASGFDVTLDPGAKTRTIDFARPWVDLVRAHGGLAVEALAHNARPELVNPTDPGRPLTLRLTSDWRYREGETLPATLRVRLMTHGKLDRPTDAVHRPATAWRAVTGAPRDVGDDPADADRDGLTDDDELARGTNPRAWDTDADGLDDRADPEPLVNGIGKLFEPKRDTDGDGIDDATEYENLTSPFHADTDGDGLDDAEDDDPFVHREAKPTAKVAIRDYNGLPTLFVDDTPHAGVCGFFDVAGKVGNHPDLFVNMARADMPIMVYKMNSFPYGDRADAFIEDFDNSLRQLMAAAPNAYLLLRLPLTPSDDFARDFPEGLKRFGDAGHRHAKTYLGSLDRWSYASREFTAAYGQGLIKLINYLRRQPYGNRLMAYKILGGYTNEWRRFLDYPRYRKADQGPAMTRALREYAIERYGGDVRRLRAAWRDASVDFATLAIRDTSDWGAGAWNLLGKMPADLADPFYDRPILDYDATYLRANLRQSEAFCRIAHKAASGNAFTGASGTYRIDSFDDLEMDFRISPNAYKFRRPGRGRMRFYAYGSLRRHDMFSVVEEDLRTHKAKWFQPHESPQTLPAALEVLKRAHARELCLGEMGYYMQFAHNWYNDPAIFELIRKQQLATRIALHAPRDIEAGVALVRSAEHVQHGSRFKGASWEYNACGAPVDALLLEDVLRDPNPYRLLVLNAAPTITLEQHKAFKQRVAKDGRLIVFMMGSGTIAPDAERPLSTEHLTELTGMTFDYVGGSEVKAPIKLTAAGAELAGKAKGERLFDPGAPYYKNWRTALKRSPFVVRETEGVTVLGRYPDGSVAWAEIDRGDHRAMYLGATRMTPELVANLVDRAGIHRYGEPDNLLAANRSLICYHPRTSGRHVIRLPRRSDVYELYEGRWIAEDVDRIEETLEGKTTRFYLLADREVFEPIVEQERRRQKARIDAIRTAQAKTTAPELETGTGPFSTGFHGTIKHYLGAGPYLMPGGEDARKPERRAWGRKVIAADLVGKLDEDTLKPGGKLTVKGKTFEWSGKHGLGAFFTMTDLGYDEDNPAVYWLTFVLEMPKERTIEMTWWTDDFSRLELNGELVFTSPGTPLGTQTRELRCREGENRFVITIVNTGGPGGWGMQLLNEQGKPLRHRKYRLE